jgi:type I restriction enzyme S subunit
MDSECVIPLRDVSIRITKGTTPTTVGHYFLDSGINFVKSEAIGNDGTLDGSTFAFISENTHAALARSQLKEGDVLFSMAGVYLGKTAVVPKSILPANTNQAVGIIRLDPDKADPRYIHYVLSSSTCRSWVQRSVAQSAQPNFNLADIGDLPIPNVPLGTQRAIAHILGTLDNRVELHKKMNQTLESMARALFKSWFVDFDPVRANMEGRDPGLTKEIADLFPSRMAESELGEIPEGWEVKSFAETVEILGGGTPKTSVTEYWNGDIPWFSVVDAPTGSDVWVVETEKKVTRDGIENSSAQVLPICTTIISARGTVGRIALTGAPMAMNQSCYGLRPRNGARGFFTYFATRELVTRLQQHAHGSVFDTITRDTLAGVVVVEPPSALIRHFEVQAAPMLERIRTDLLCSVSLAALRDTLLPKLISGELRVKDPEKFVPRVGA